jgi:hypothetical protein
MKIVSMNESAPPHKRVVDGWIRTRCLDCEIEYALAWVTVHVSAPPDRTEGHDYGRPLVEWRPVQTRHVPRLARRVWRGSGMVPTTEVVMSRKVRRTPRIHVFNPKPSSSARRASHITPPKG